jgi:hypothetical protein
MIVKNKTVFLNLTNGLYSYKDYKDYKDEHDIRLVRLQSQYAHHFPYIKSIEIFTPELVISLLTNYETYLIDSSRHRFSDVQEQMMPVLVEMLNHRSHVYRKVFDPQTKRAVKKLFEDGKNVNYINYFVKKFGNKKPINLHYEGMVVLGGNKVMTQMKTECNNFIMINRKEYSFYDDKFNRWKNINL